jgi:hypothetical protein
MSRKAKLTNIQVEIIRHSIATQKELSKQHGVSLLTIWKVKNFKGTYAVKPEDIGTPILDSSGNTVGVARVVSDSEPINV